MQEASRLDRTIALVRAEQLLQSKLARTLPQRRSPAVYAAHQLDGSPLEGVSPVVVESNVRVLSASLARACLFCISAEDVPQMRARGTVLALVSAIGSPYHI